MANKGARQFSRQLAMQALYAWTMTQEPMIDIQKHLLNAWDVHDPLDRSYFSQLLSEIPTQLSVYKEKIEELGQRPYAQISLVEQAILLIGVHELMHYFEIPTRVVINEAIELTKEFGAENGHRFVNNVLDKVAAEVRSRPASDK